MVTDYTPIFLRSRNFQWYWNSTCSSDPCCSNTEEHWQRYSDIENEIIEDAHNEKKGLVEIDGGYAIDLDHLIQRKNGDTNSRSSIKRVQLDGDRRNVHLREERFSCSPILSSVLTTTSMNGDEDLSENGDALNLLQASNGFLGAYCAQELKEKNKTVTDMIEDAAEGIMTEGSLLAKTHEAQWLAAQLLGLKQSPLLAQADIPTSKPPCIIGETCVCLYTQNSFWYELLNRVLRNPQSITNRQVKTMGPFWYLFNMFFSDIHRFDFNTVYRGLNLSDEEREQLMKKEEEIHFKAYTSTSKNRTLAEWFGNTLLIIDLEADGNSIMMNYRRFSGGDISEISYFKDEEEFLMRPGLKFKFVKYEYDKEKEKHIIYIKFSSYH